MPTLVLLRRSLRQPIRTRVEGQQLQAAHRLPTSQLAFDGVAHPKRHRHELADRPGAGVDPVEPRLVGADEIVLFVRVQRVAPGPA